MQSRYQLSLNARSATIALVACLAALMGYLSPSQQDLQPSPTHASLFPAELLASSRLHNRVFAADGSEARHYAFGRWKTPVENVTFDTDSQSSVASWRANTFRTKMWHYSSFNTKDYFIGVAIINVSEAGFDSSRSPIRNR